MANKAMGLTKEQGYLCQLTPLASTLTFSQYQAKGGGGKA